MSKKNQEKKEAIYFSGVLKKSFIFENPCNIERVFSSFICYNADNTKKYTGGR